MSSFILFVVSLELTIFFVLSGSAKIIGIPQFVYQRNLTFFKQCGLNQWILLLVGVAELLGAVTLWFPNYLGVLGLLTLCITSAGIVYCRVHFDEWKNGLVSMTTFIFAVCVLVDKVITFWL